MPRFMDENFLLRGRAARALYHRHAKGMPIYDYHCHLPPKDIADNRKFAGITEIWLGGDHYKWRAMRASGVPERLITGDAPDREKFKAWAETVPSTIGNPLYHWTHLELKRYFGVSKLLSPATADEIYEVCNALLAQEGFRTRGLLTRMNVRVVCTTDDPTDPLEAHARLRTDPVPGVTVVPTFRPDAALGIEDPASFNAWVDRLGKAAGMDISRWQDFIEAIRTRHDAFHQAGCRASDHGIEVPYAEEHSDADARRIFMTVRAGAAPERGDAAVFKTAVMAELARMDAEKKWVMQVHVGALRDVNTRYRKLLGPNTGFDTIGDAPLARSMARFLDRLDAEGSLPKTVLFCLNPSDNAVLSAMAGCFPEENVRGKMQFGPAWWFNDQKRGMEEQMKSLSEIGLLSRFVGMVTDSRSFLSYPRHEYFRRILCGFVGSAVESGETPRDMEALGAMVRDICYNNAAAYFNVPLTGA